MNGVRVGFTPPPDNGYTDAGTQPEAQHQAENRAGVRFRVWSLG